LKKLRLRSWQQFERRGSGVAWPNQWLCSDPIPSIWKKRSYSIKHRLKYLGGKMRLWLYNRFIYLCFIYFFWRKNKNILWKPFIIWFLFVEQSFELVQKKYIYQL
jgi:hypothetical protein